MARRLPSFLTLALAFACCAPPKKPASEPAAQACKERSEALELDDPEESETDQEAEEREAREEEERERQRQREREQEDRHLILTLGAKPPWAALKDKMPAEPPVGPLRPEPPALPSGLPTVWKAGKAIGVRLRLGYSRPKRELPTPQGSYVKGGVSADKNTLALLDRGEGTVRFIDLASGKGKGWVSIATATRDEPANFAFARELVEPDRVLVAHRSSVILAHPDVYKRRRLAEVGGTNIEPTQRYGLYGIANFAGGARDGGNDLYLQWISGELAAHISGSKRLCAWSLSESGKTLGLLHAGSEMVEIVDLEQGRSLALFSAPAYPRSIAVSPSGQLVAVGGSSLLLFSLRPGEEILEILPQDEPIERLAFSPQGDLLLITTGSAVSSHALPENMEDLTTLPRAQVLHRGDERAHLSMSADGRLLLIASSGGMRTWSR